MSMTVNTNPTVVSWQTLLNQVNEMSGTQEVSDTNRAVTFTTEVNGATTTMTVNIPDDLDLPSAVTPEAIESLMGKLANTAGLNLNETQLATIKEEITKVYNQMASALTTVQSSSVGAVLFDLYQLMALLVEVAQSQRNAARDLRNTQNLQIQNSIQAQADAQRNAAIVGLVVGVTCGVLSAAVSVGMLVGQAAAYKTQVNTARMSGMEATQNKVTMLQKADTPEHAQAQLAKVEGGIKTPGLADGVKDTISTNTADAKAKFEAAQTVDAKQAGYNEATARVDEAKHAETQATEAVETRKTELATATKALNDEAKTQSLLGVDVPPVEISGGKTAAEAKAEYIAKCEAAEVEPAAGVLRMYDEVTTAQGNLDAATATKAQATQTVEQRTQEQTTAKTELDVAKDAAKAIDAPEDLATARREYRAALELEADRYATEYENAVAQKAPRAEIAAVQGSPWPCQDGRRHGGAAAEQQPRLQGLPAPHRGVHRHQRDQHGDRQHAPEHDAEHLRGDQLRGDAHGRRPGEGAGAARPDERPVQSGAERRRRRRPAHAGGPPGRDAVDARRNPGIGG